MADPVTIMMGIAIAGAAASAVGSIKAGNEQAAVDKYNAGMQQQQANESLAAGNTQAAIGQQQTTEKMGQAAAAYGAAGVDMSGSPLEVMSSLAAKGELNRRLTLYQGQTGAAKATNQAGLDLASGGMAQQAGVMQAGTTLLTAAGKIGTMASGLSAGSSPYTSGASNVAANGLHVGGT
jgi:type II secretory pathway pseudopilin PulG